MAYSVLITRNRDKKKSVMLYDFDFESDFWWSEGNMSCDCNRGMEFARGLGTYDGEDYPCGMEEYSIEIYDVVGGELLYEDHVEVKG